MKNLEYISVRIIAKPNLEGFVNIDSFDSKAKAGEFEEKEDTSYYYSSNQKLLLQYVQKKPDNPSTIIGEPIPRHFKTAESFMVFGKPRSVLNYLKKNHPEEHLRLKNYLERGLDTEFVKKVLDSKYFESYELLSGIKLTPKEKKK